MHRLLHLSRVRIRRGIAWLWSQEGTPGQRARGLAAGVFCGCYPFFGLQMVLSVGLAKLMRGNQLLAAAGTLVSNPFTYLPLYWFNYLVGCRLMGPSVDPLGAGALNRSNLWAQGWEFSQRILLGSSVMGLVLASTSGVLAYRLFRHQHRQQSDAANALIQTRKKPPSPG